MMENETDLYLTLKKNTEEEVYKEKGSKFLAYAFPITSADQVDDLLQLLKKAHPKARHWCYAWQTGVENPVYRYNDDGEPNNSAGKPIFGQIQSFGLTDVLVIVVRYFGGTKLGVGGLVTAYRSAARLALENASLVEKMILETLSLRVDYANMDKVMRIIKENSLSILDQKLELDCFFKVSVRKSKLDQMIKVFKELRIVEVKRVN
jgi:uncharacterized YigZ family protein